MLREYLHLGNKKCYLVADGKCELFDRSYRAESAPVKQ